MNSKSVKILRLDIAFFLHFLIRKKKRFLENCQVFFGGHFLTFWTHFLTLNNAFKKRKNMYLLDVFYVIFLGRCATISKFQVFFWGLFSNFSTRFLTLNNAFKKRKNMRLDITFLYFFNIKKPFLFCIRATNDTKR